MNFIIAIVIFGGLIFIHEFGHFIAGVAVGVPVEVFSIGYGPEIFSFKIRGVKFQLAWIPFGGFCRFKGEDPSKNSLEPDDYMNVHPLKRIAIVFNGPFFNLLLAVFLFSLLAIPKVPVDIYPSEIDVHTDYRYVGTGEGPTIAYEKGLRSGDEIVAIDGESVSNFSGFFGYFGRIQNLALGREIPITYVRDGVSNSVVVTTEDMWEHDLQLGIQIASPLTIGTLADGFPAQQHGLQTNDTILAINGVQANSAVQVTETIFDTSAGEKLTFTVERDGTVTNIEIVPKQVRTQDGFRGQAGFSFAAPEAIATEERGVGFTPMALVRGVQETWTQISVQGQALGMVVTGRIPFMKSIGGPVAIIDQTAQVARGFNIPQILYFVAIISLVLAVMNLLPIPVLDGSMILYSLYELITGRKINRNVLMNIQTAGLIFLLALGAFVLLNDIAVRIF